MFKIGGEINTKARKVTFTFPFDWEKVKRARNYGQWDGETWVAFSEMGERKAANFRQLVEEGYFSLVDGEISDIEVKQARKSQAATEKRKATLERKARLWEKIISRYPKLASRRGEAKKTLVWFYDEFGFWGENEKEFAIAARACRENYRHGGIVKEYLRAEYCNLTGDNIIQKALNAYARHRLTNYDSNAGVARAEMTEIGRGGLGF